MLVPSVFFSTCSWFPIILAFLYSSLQCLFLIWIFILEEDSLQRVNSPFWTFQSFSINSARQHTPTTETRGYPDKFLIVIGNLLQGLQWSLKRRSIKSRKLIKRTSRANAIHMQNCQKPRDAAKPAQTSLNK